MASNNIRVQTLGQSQDHSSLESNAANSSTINEALGSDSDSSNLPHLGSTVAHLLIGKVGHLDAQLLDQFVVNVGGVRCGNAG